MRCDMRISGVLLLLLSTVAIAQLPDAPSSAYPNALFVVETSILTGAIIENGRASTSERYSSRGDEIPPRTTPGRYAAVHSVVYAGTVLGSWKLQHNRHKPVKIIGHLLPLGVITYYFVSYFNQ